MQINSGQPFEVEDILFKVFLSGDTSSHAAVKQFYVDRQYGGSLNESAIVCVALQAQALVGVVQLCPEAGYWALRGMQIHTDFQRLGIGSNLLHLATELLDQSCYCIPWSHLERFYQQVGFQKIGVEQAPVEVGDRYLGYTNQGLDVILMQRLARG